MKTISPEKLNTLIEGGEEVRFLDARSPAECRAMHAASASNLPLDQISGEPGAG